MVSPLSLSANESNPPIIRALFDFFPLGALMGSCQSNRCGGGCCDFSSKAPQKPSLLQLDVVDGIFTAAIRNMTLRKAQCQTGLMSDKEYEAAKEKLVDWLVATFSGRNPHFSTEAEWHEYGGLVELLRLRLPIDGSSQARALTQAFELFATEADELAGILVHNGGLETENAKVVIGAKASAWAQLFVGAPDDWMA